MPMKVLGPCTAAAAWELVAGAEALEEADEVGVVPVPEAAVEAAAVEVAAVEAAVEAALEAVKVTPCKKHRVSIFANLTNKNETHNCKT